MKRFSPASPTLRRFLLTLPTTLLLLFLLLWSMGFPALTPEAVLRRMGRENLIDPGEIVASGQVTFEHTDWPSDGNANYWTVSYGNGSYHVATMNRFWGIFLRPSNDSWNLYTHFFSDEFPLGAWAVNLVGDDASHETAAIYLTDPSATRLDFSLYRIPAALRETSDQAWVDCELIRTDSAVRQAPGVWFLQQTTPSSQREGDAYGTRITAYGADGSVLFDV